MIRNGIDSPYNGSGALTREQFLYYKTRTVARLMVDDGLNDKEIVDAIIADNLFQYPTEKSLKNVSADGTETVEMSIAQLVSEIKEYGNSKPDNFRLLFMIDEVGQYIGSNTDHLINLQSLVEKIGSECEGRVRVVISRYIREML